MIDVPAELYEPGDFYPSKVRDAEKLRSHIYAKITYMLDGTVFTDEDFSAEGIRISTYTNDGNVLKIGCAVCSQIEFTLLSTAKTSATNLWGVVKVEFGIDIENYGILWVQRGEFIIRNVVKDTLQNGSV